MPYPLLADDSPHWVYVHLLTGHLCLLNTLMTLFSHLLYLLSAISHAVFAVLEQPCQFSYLVFSGVWDLLSLDDPSLWVHPSYCTL
jgi:hypothetical protein